MDPGSGLRSDVRATARAGRIGSGRSPGPTRAGRTGPAPGDPDGTRTDGRRDGPGATGSGIATPGDGAGRNLARMDEVGDAGTEGTVDPAEAEIIELERELCRLPEVSAARIVTDRIGRPTEVHILAQGAKHPK